MKRIESSPRCYLEADVVRGLVPVAANELRYRFGNLVTFQAVNEAGTVRFHLEGDWQALEKLRTVTAVYFCCIYPVPRPKALLGHQHLQHLLAQIEAVRHYSRAHSFRSFRMDAAGRDSAVFHRLKAAITERTGLVHDDEDGDLLLRVRPGRQGKAWEVLCRLTPRPLSVRAWRVVDMPGALDATIAAAMVRISVPKAADRYLNLMCGSGTLMVERLLQGQAARVAGCDVDRDALGAARQNLAKVGVAQHVELHHEDATQLPFAAGSFDMLVADLPWGQLVGSHTHNLKLYPQVLREAARVAAQGARFLLITHKARLMERVLREQDHCWRRHEVIELQRGNLHPRIYLLQRV